MSRIFGLLALLVAADACIGGASAADAPPIQAAAEAGPPTLPGHLADLELIWNGIARHGRLIVSGDGDVHVEHLDEDVRSWVCAAIRRVSSPSLGWDDRTDPVGCVWCRVGPRAALAEIRTPAASIAITRHQLLPAR